MAGYEAASVVFRRFMMNDGRFGPPGEGREGVRGGVRGKECPRDQEVGSQQSRRGVPRKGRREGVMEKRVLLSACSGGRKKRTDRASQGTSRGSRSGKTG
jgi:hypothetical protein